MNAGIYRKQLPRQVSRPERFADLGVWAEKALTLKLVRPHADGV
jgi:hypothetical protein